MTSSRPYDIVTVKVGSNVLSKADGTPDEERICSLVSQISELQKEGIKVVLVSSGAVASGRKIISSPQKHDPVSSRQLWASIGQVRLLNLYDRFFEKHGLTCAQILATKENFSDRHHFLNMKNCIGAILSEKNVVPIVNENDVVSINELMFTDNDELAGLIAELINADALIILSNIDGIFDGDPGEASSRLIPVINPENISQIKKYISPSKSSFGRGGMQTKVSTARKVALSGTPVYLANGSRDGILTDLVLKRKDVLCTYFTPSGKSSSVKKWLSFSESDIRGEIHINEGAENYLYSRRGTSLLPVGVTSICGSFVRGDVVGVFNSKGVMIGVGKAEYSSETASRHIGVKNSKPIIHYNYLYIKND